MARDLDDSDQGLTEADRRAIDKIRRELDAEFGPLGESERSAEIGARKPATDLRAPRPAPDVSPAKPAADVRPAQPAPDVRPTKPAPDFALREPRVDLGRPEVRAESRRPESLEVRDVPIERRPAAPRGESHPSPRPPRPVIMFLLCALIGGMVGGVGGGATVLLWLHTDDSLPRPFARNGGASSDSPAAVPGRVAEDRSVEIALHQWLDATKRGDIERQMDFYPARVPIYYTWRDVPRAAVRDEKIKVFGAATELHIEADTPSVELTDGGRGAVTRFRKRYVIDGPEIRRRGEVLQELRWTRTADGWRIVGERDAEVLAQ